MLVPLNMFQDWRSNTELKTKELKINVAYLSHISWLDVKLEIKNDTFLFYAWFVYIFKFDLRSWKVCNEIYIYFWFWAFWCIERWNLLKNGQVSEIDLQYWPRPPSWRVWPPILKHVKGNPHLFLISSILMY